MNSAVSYVEPGAQTLRDDNASRVEVRKLTCLDGDRAALDDVSFAVPAGTTLAVLGPPRSGKTTLFRCLLGLGKTYSGSCLIGGVSTKDAGARAVSELAAFIPEPRRTPFNFSVYDMARMGTRGRDGGARAVRALDRMGLLELKDRGFMDISAGERQLVLMAGSLARDVKAILLDEPALGLDYGSRIRVLSRARSLAREGRAVLISTQSPEEAFRFSDSVLALRNGVVVGSGPSSEALSPELIGALFSVKAEIVCEGGDESRACVPTMYYD